MCPSRPAPHPHPSGLAKGSAKGGRRGSSCRGQSAAPHPRRGEDPPEHPTSFPLQFYQRPGSQAGDRRPALTRISPEIARYAGPGSGARSPPSPLLCVALRLSARRPRSRCARPVARELVCIWPRLPDRGGQRRAGGTPTPRGTRQGHPESPRCSSASRSPSQGRGGGREPRGAQGSASGGGVRLGGAVSAQGLVRTVLFALPKNPEKRSDKGQLRLREAMILAQGHTAA